MVYPDVYGNLVTNIPAEALPAAEVAEIRIKGRSIIGLNSSFNDENEGNDRSRQGDARLIALAGSHGYLEVAVPNGSAAALLKAGDGEAVEVVTVSG